MGNTVIFREALRSALHVYFSPVAVLWLEQVNLFRCLVRLRSTTESGRNPQKEQVVELCRGFTRYTRIEWSLKRCVNDSCI